jgi:hypothetical protein
MASHWVLGPRHSKSRQNMRHVHDRGGWPTAGPVERAEHDYMVGMRAYAPSFLSA